MKAKDIKTGKFYAYTSGRNRETSGTRVEVLDANPVYARGYQGTIVKKGDGAPVAYGETHNMILVRSIPEQPKGAKRRFPKRDPSLARPRDILGLWEEWSSNADALRKAQQAEWEAENKQRDADEAAREELSAQLTALGIEHATGYGREGQDILLSIDATRQLDPDIALKLLRIRQ